MKKLFALLCFACASCGVYQSKWDCPPGEGVRCKPVSEVLGMIVENEGEQDLFIKDSDEARLLRESRKKKRQPQPILPNSANDKKL